MNKKILGLVTVALGTTLISTTAFADSATEMTTDAAINFFSSNKPSPGPFEDNLSFAYVPASFNFGKQDVTGVSGNVTYQQVAPSKQQYLSVSDDRTTKANWNVVAVLSEMSTADGSSSLENANLSFKVANPKEYNIDIAASDAAQSATPVITDTGAVTEFTDLLGTYTPTIDGSQTITLPANGTDSSTVLKYTIPTTGSDKKTLAVAAEVSSVKLSIAGVSSALDDKAFKGAVTWTLSDTL